MFKDILVAAGWILIPPVAGFATGTAAAFISFLYM